MAGRVTIVDVAREAGVAISTVSAALNDRPGVAPQTRLAVRAAADRLGWVPSLRGRSLSSRRTYSVGMVIQRNPRVLEADPFFWGFIAGVEGVLDRHGYGFVLHTAPTAPRMLERIRDLALRRGIDGIFLTDVRTRDPRFALLQELALPGVAVNVPASRSPISTVDQDHEQALRQVMDLLLELGHRRIAHVAGSPGLVHSAQRRRVWRSHLADAGLATDLLCCGDFTIDAGRAAARELMARPDPPTAVVCANDLTAMGLLSGLGELGLRCPDDVSVTGFDGIAMGEFSSTPLTTVATLPHELGRSAARLLLDAIGGQQRSDVTVEPARLVQRRSVAAPPGGLLRSASPAS